MKINYKTYLSSGSLSLILALTAPTLQAKTLAMVIGINQYKYEPVLDGAVNDAKDIENALRQNGIKDIRSFHNYDATKVAIKARWQAMLRNSKAGDTLIVSYAGHGVQRKDYSGDELSDHLDEAMPLSLYKNESMRGNINNLILDDEWDEMFAKATGREVIFVIDACHSGTMDRGLLKNVFKQRSFPIAVHHKPEKIIDNQPAHSNKKRQNVLTLSATVADKKVREVDINGQRRGLLSWAFANGMRGKADFNSDGNIARQELSRYIKIAVQKRMPSQLPQFLPAGAFRSNKPMFTSAKKLSPKKPVLTVTLSPVGGEHVSFSTTGNKYPYLTLYNTTQNGTVQFLYPQGAGEAQTRHRDSFNLKLKVDKSFTGNEKITAIYSAKPQAKLHKLLSSLHDRRGGISVLNGQKNRLLSKPYEEKSHKHYVSR